MTARTDGKPIASPDDTLEVALSLARAGWPVFPVKLVPTVDEHGVKRTDKKPLVKWGEGATTDAETIATWFAADFPGAWVGVHAERAGIVVVDIDVAKGTDARDGKQNLKAAGIDLPKTFRYKTRSGGSHHVYRAPRDRVLTIDKNNPVPGVDIRAGNGLMVYYGPVLTETPELAAAPDWSLIDRARQYERGEGDVAKWLARTLPGKPTKAVKAARDAVTAEGMGHDEMLRAVSDLVRLGSERGVGAAYEYARAVYLTNYPDDARHWDNAAEGSVAQHGLPPVTFAIPKDERKEIQRRNSPEVKEAKALEKKAAFRAEKTLARAEPDAPVDIGHRDLTDASLAEEIHARLEKKWAHTGGTGILRYDGVVWRPVDEALLIEATRKLLRKIRAEETAAAILRGGSESEKRIIEARGIESRTHVVAIARFVSGMLLEREPVLDADPDLLNCPNGVVDLRTGEMRKRRPDDYFTKVTGAEYDPAAVSRDWTVALKALPRATREWLQVRLGQAATGRIAQDKSIPFMVGGGDNGKSVIVGGVRNALGTYAVTVPERLLLGSENDHPTDIMTLQGARFASFEELPRGGRLNAQRIKLLAGTNTLSGRRMRQDFTEFSATHTLAGATNHLPVITDVDDAIWERVAPVPFPYKFVPRKPRKGTNERRGDPGLRDRLADRPDSAVLTWLVIGAVVSYKGVPAKPKAVTDALEEWRGDADPVLGFTRDNLELDETSAIVATDLYAEFGRYLEGRGQQRWSDQLIATSFSGHSSLPGVIKRQVRFGPGMTLSRPSAFITATTTVPPRPMSWVGIRFKKSDSLPSEAEHDAAALADLERRVK